MSECLSQNIDPITNPLLNGVQLLHIDISVHIYKPHVFGVVQTRGHACVCCMKMCVE